jgi:hypothetical protein
MPKHITHPVSEPSAQPFDDLLHRVTVPAGVAAKLNQRDLGVGWPENVIAVQVDRRIEHVESRTHHDSKGQRMLKVVVTCRLRLIQDRLNF